MRATSILRRQGTLERLDAPPLMLQTTSLYNYSFMAHFSMIVGSKPEFADCFGLSLDRATYINNTKRGPDFYSNLPVPIFGCRLHELKDWESIFTKGYETKNVRQIKSETPSVSAASLILAIREYNIKFVQHLLCIDSMSLAGTAIAGISREIVDFLASLPAHQIYSALDRLDAVPLYRLRINHDAFWDSDTTLTPTIDNIVQHVLLTESIGAPSESNDEAWTNPDVDPQQRMQIAGALASVGLRAVTISNILQLSIYKIRRLHRRLNGTPSTTGIAPSSLQWYFDSSARRIQAALLVWLYCFGRAQNLTAPEAFLFSVQIYGRIYGSDAVISADRAYVLLRQSDFPNGLQQQQCEQCEAIQLCGDPDTSPEISLLFDCPRCRGAEAETEQEKSF